ncbi:MAG: hypothetical protein IJQ82_06475 [Selenomonadaceae bacterium]|nr:hypothetical protein [Selenomonadaceae bacterium]
MTCDYTASALRDVSPSTGKKRARLGYTATFDYVSSPLRYACGILSFLHLSFFYHSRNVITKFGRLVDLGHRNED